MGQYANQTDSQPEKTMAYRAMGDAYAQRRHADYSATRTHEGKLDLIVKPVASMMEHGFRRAGVTRSN